MIRMKEDIKGVEKLAKKLNQTKEDFEKEKKNLGITLFD